MIQANCRNSFTIDDFNFIIDTLSIDEQNKVALTELLVDESMRDDILDHELLFKTIMENPGFTKISPYLYFYVLIRRAFLKYQITNRDISDYVATMLAEFGSTNRTFSISTGAEDKYFYLTDMLSDFVEASSSFEAFLLQSHLGNYSLFMTGVFPDYINRKATYGRGAPGFDYYEKMGSSGYLFASQHKLAAKYKLVEILAKLAQDFRKIRIALNTLADDFLSLNDSPDDLDSTLRKIFYGRDEN